MVIITRGNSGRDGGPANRAARVARCLKTGYFILSFLVIGAMIALGMMFGKEARGSSPIEQHGNHG